MDSLDLAIVGAGAAGCFAACVCSTLDIPLRAAVFEKTKQSLAKVKISGGGRCNVTHYCFDPKKLTTYYPRGSSFLRNVFYRFQPKDMIEWLEQQGVQLKVESDGRMFPMSDNSETIVSCFLGLIEKGGIDLLFEREVDKIVPCKEGFELIFKRGNSIQAKNVLFATGGFHKSYSVLQDLGHRLHPPVPSLFTFDLDEPWLHELSGVVLSHAEVKIVETDLASSGPVLITHWGLSGPAVLKLSAWAARDLSELGYRAKIEINWIGEQDEGKVRSILAEEKRRSSSKRVSATPLFHLPKNFWRQLTIHQGGVVEDRLWAHLSKEEMALICKALLHARFDLKGKSLNKEEFVTCGGVSLEEIDPRTMESKIVSNLYFAGEVMDIDGVTGGFNFQSAWSTAWIAVQAIAGKMSK